MMSEPTLHGRTALVTGGNSGIGLATARLFVQRGGRVLITGRDRTTLDAAVDELGEAATAVQADVQSLPDIDRTVDAAKACFDHLDLLFVNAGAGIFAPITDIDEATYDQMMDSNLKGAFFTIQKALPLFNGGGGSIVVNTSVAGVKAYPYSSVYAASKAGLRSFVRTYAAELAERGIRVNSVAPGSVVTPALARMGIPPEALDAAAQELAEHTLLKRVGKPEEIAETVLFLASPGAAHITGIELYADGGAHQV
jgi:NAD(P)-dependent dehydrogenase (short-subunit alcohol dehydrogenase family)